MATDRKRDTAALSYHKEIMLSAPALGLWADICANLPANAFSAC
jgi:hypothetical protein